MGYVSKYDTKLVTFLNRRYKRYKVRFKNFDDYILWLFYYLCRSNETFYYSKLEKDVWAYSDWQTGSPREMEKKNDDWKKMEYDPYHLYNGDYSYLEYLRRNNWNEEKDKSRR